ncbi:MAG TPA: DNA-binding protein, partial [Methylococcales bacterium]|nr:DNA-binding protein [Methylococcales bacterium]
MTLYKDYFSLIKQNLENLKFIRIAKVQAIYGISPATVYRWIESGKLPEPTR